MSKTVKRKVSVEPSSKSRLSVFQRLGTKKSKSISQESKSLSDDFKQTLSAAVSITTKPILLKPDAVELEDADPDILEKKREEIRKELELQMKMDSRRIASRKRKHAESSSSSSSSSDSDSSSTSSSSSSSDNRHKSRKLKLKRRDSSSSSDEYAKKLAKKKRLIQSKKEALKLHKLSKKHEIAVTRKTKKRSASPLAKKHRGDSSSVMLSPSGQKVMVKNLKISTSLDKHHRVREKELERSELLPRSERERLRMRSRSPRMTRSRTPKRNSPSVLRRSPTDVKRNRSLSHRMDSEHERREKEREMTRDKERREALLRSQERQRERERLTTKDSKGQRLLPRPAERATMQAMALAAAQERNTDKDIGYNNRSFGSDRPDSFEHRRHEKETREHERYDKYESHGRREQSEYQHQHGSNYRRDWHEESSSKDLYERSIDHQSSSRDWDHKRNENIRAGDYSERKDWNDSVTKWADRGKPTEKYERRSGQSDYIPHSSRNYAERPESFDAGSTPPVSKAMGVSCGIRGRWSTSWRGRGRGAHHHNDFRRPHHHTEILEERGEIYRRHINPQGANLNKSAAKPSDTPATVSTPTEKQSDDTSKQSSLMADDNPDGEEIADDLSEISDEADEILGQQEETKQAIENVVIEKPVTDIDSKEIAVSAVKDSVDGENDKSIDPNSSVQMRENLTPTKSPEESDRTKEICDDIDLDFEEISDGELEEEARTKGLGDALGVDWASLVEESKAMMREKLTKTETSAKQRWNPDQILLDVGVSYKMAGKAFAQKTLMNAYENIRRELKCAKIKIEPNDDSNNMDETQVKIENENDTEVPNVNGKCSIEDETILNVALPCVQTSTQNTAEKQRQLVFSATGPYSRGLCCKRDIELRRKLCNLSVCENNCKTVATKTGYENNAISLFQKFLQA